MSQEFSEKVILITGAASGIGAATALSFSKAGAKLSLIDINLKNLQKIGAQCSKIEPLLIEANMLQETDIKTCVEETLKKFGQIDILINCAGIYEQGNIETTSLQQFDKIFNINVRAVYELTRLTVPYLIKTKGNIINLSSIAATHALPKGLAYGLSKAAINHFTTILAADLAEKQVRVNSINPGTIVTNIYKNGGMTDKELESFLEKSKMVHPMKRLGTTDDVVNAIMFLASDKALFLTGVHLPVDGGRHISQDYK